MSKELTEVNVVEGADKLVNIFGRWPSFHDAEVVRLVLDRKGDKGPTLELQIHLFEMTPEIDSKGFYVLTKHTLATFLFSGISNLKLDDFNHQNVLQDLEFTEAGSDQHGKRLSVTLSTSYGLDGEFECATAAVVRAEPFAA